MTKAQLLAKIADLELVHYRNAIFMKRQADECTALQETIIHKDNIIHNLTTANDALAEGMKLTKSQTWMALQLVSAAKGIVESGV